MRYLLLLILNVPIIVSALINIVTEYKLKKTEASRFRRQLLAWVVILIVLLGSFPLYNTLMGRPLFDSTELSSFDIVQTTAIVFLLYVFNNMRRRLETAEGRSRELHQELSIILSQRKS